MAAEGCGSRIQVEGFGMARISERQANVVRQHEETLKAQKPLWAESNLLRSLLYAQPVCYVQTMSSFHAIKPGELFHGCWIDDTATCDYAGKGFVKDQASFDSGFVMSFGGHYFTSGVWVGETLQHLTEVSTTLGIDVADEALQSLVENGEPVYFVRPDYPQHCPVYALDINQAADVRAAGYQTEEQNNDGTETKWRSVQIGDQLVPMPPGSDWPRPMLVFPSDWLPEDRYRRV